jgi:CRISPR-associated protein Csx10
MSETHVTFVLRLEMLSDWNIGSGAGRQGSLDSAVERDADELPYVPATTLRGIWRDAAEQVAFGLDGGKGRWCRLVDHLFGSQPAIDERGAFGDPPIPGRLEVTDLRFPAALRAKFRGEDRTALRASLTLAKPGVAIDIRSGRARTDFLRFEEVARQGAVLTGKASIALSGDMVTDEALLCLALGATRLVERMGGDRRRGCGRCVLAADRIEGPDGLPRDIPAAVDRLASPAPPQIAPPGAAAPLGTTYGASTDEEFLVIPLDVAVETPTVVAQAVLGNVVTSIDHVPGTMLLSAIARMLGDAGIEPSVVSRAIAAGDIRVLPAYPEICGRRSLPTPFVFDRKKYTAEGSHVPGSLRNRLLEHESSSDGEYNSVREAYFAFGRQDGLPAVAFRDTTLVTRTHNTVEDERQKPTEVVGGVYSYEAIAARQRLKSEIWLRRSLLPEGFELPLLPVGVTIGRAKKAGYGVVRLVPHAAIAAGTFSGPLLPNAFTLYLASDLVLPSSAKPIGASPAEFLCAALRDLLGVPIEIARADLRTGRTEGWVSRWGLPRPSYVVLRAGSTASFTADSPDRVRLAVLARDGLGARRGEGFGHILIDPDFTHAKLAASVVLTAPAQATDEETSEPGDELTEFISRVENAALRDRIRFRAELAAQQRNEKLHWTKDKPNMSQLGALRSVMAGLRPGLGLGRIKQFIARQTSRAEKWGSGNPENDTHPLKVLAALFNDPQTVWSKIEMTESDWANIVITRQTADASRDAELQRFAIANFLFAAMRVHKRSMEMPEKEVA